MTLRQTRERRSIELAGDWHAMTQHRVPKSLNAVPGNCLNFVTKHKLCKLKVMAPL